MSKWLVVSMMIITLIIMPGCERRGGVQVGVTSGGTGGGNKPVEEKKVKGDKLVTTTVTTSQKVEELVPPPPVKKITVTTDTATTSTLNGVPVRPDIQVHETPKINIPEPGK